MSAAPSLQSSLATQGFHFTLSTTLSVPIAHALDRCPFHLLYDLDPHVYADQYELAQRPGYTSLLWGTSDLERPVSAVDPKGTLLLITADNTHITREQNSNITLDVPLHARYGRPSQSSDTTIHHIDLKLPVGFFACVPDSEYQVCSPSPVPDVLRPYTSLPGWPTLSLSVVQDTSPNDFLRVAIPVGIREDVGWVDVGTAVVMIAMFFYLLFTSICTARRLASKPYAKTD
ncbi:PIG-X [Ganoderma leucocontextum]|nr:PIG-X [Ganoderma leucocontextum]